MIFYIETNLPVITLFKQLAPSIISILKKLIKKNFLYKSTLNGKRNQSPGFKKAYPKLSNPIYIFD